MRAQKKERKEIIVVMHYGWTGFCVSYKKVSSQLNLRFHRLFCIFFLSLHFRTIYGFLNNEKSWIFSSFFCLEWFQSRWTCKQKYYKSCKNCWNFIRIKRIAFIVLATKRNAHTQWDSYHHNNCCYRSKGKQMNFASRTNERNTVCCF